MHKEDEQYELRIRQAKEDLIVLMNAWIRLTKKMFQAGDDLKALVDDFDKLTTNKK